MELDDRALPLTRGPDYRLPQAAGERDPWPSAPVQLEPSVVGRIKVLSKVVETQVAEIDSIGTPAYTLWRADPKIGW